MIAEGNFLCKIKEFIFAVKSFLCVKIIEGFVEERNIGADAWKRTGVLTLDGNTKKVNTKEFNILNRCTRENLVMAPVVQLCIARNKWRLSSKRYKGRQRLLHVEQGKVSS